MLTKKQIRFCLDKIGEMYPNAHCELVHNNPFELVIAVLLSAQTTDVNVNRVTKDLFKKYKTPTDFIQVPLSELEDDIKRIGLFRNKAKNIQKLCQMLIDDYDGVVPEERDELIKFPGVGRKTANVVTSVAFDHPAIRCYKAFGEGRKRRAILCLEDSIIQGEENLNEKIPKDEWGVTHHRLIFFGRYHCTAKNPKCAVCPLLEVCREGKK